VLGLRSIHMVMSTLVTLIVGLIWTAGFTTVAIGHLNLISVAFAVLFIGLGVDFGIHLCVRYRELLARGREHTEALVETARDVGSSITLCAMTTAIGFFAFVPTEFVGVAELGLISGAGMFISLFCNVTLLPALLSLPPVPSGRGAGGLRWSSGGLIDLPVRFPRTIRATALVLGLGSIFLLPQARFDNNPLRVRDPSSESVRTFAELLERGTSSPWSLNAVAPSLESAEMLAERLRELEVVDRVVTVSNYVPSDQEQKLGIIEDVAMFRAPRPGPDGAVPPPSLDEQLAAFSDLRRELGRVIEEGDDGEFEAAAGRLAAVLEEYVAGLDANPEDSVAAMARLEQGMMGSLAEQLRSLDAALGAGHVTLENLPDTILERMITADGRVRIQIYPRADLSDHAALAAFVGEVKQITPEVAGSAAEIYESGNAVVAALKQAMISAFVVITIFLLILWRRIDDTALVLIPLLLAAALTVATAVLLDIPFNFADVIVLPLLLGIGVDSGIHLVHRARAAEAESNLLATSTARAVAFSALTTIASFGSLGFATHLGLATLGQLLTLGVGFTIVCNLVVLPALIQLRPPRPQLVSSSRNRAA
jgi:hopanoid biosynthesis associated RND transporter like protein HpnN